MKSEYVIISPCRNEAQFVRRTLDSVVSQSKKPSLWVIVDDGSIDDTPKILKEYALKYSFVSIVTIENRGHRSVGPGVIDAFYAGYDTVDIEQYDFICKLDLDLELPVKYFELLLKSFEENSRLGTCSGKPYFFDKKSNALISEKCGDENSIGASKFYRKECFLQIGGFVRQVMWDGIDGHRCRMLGWVTESYDDPEVRFIHLRPMGSSQKGIIAGRMRHGFGQYYMGTGFFYMTVSSLYRMTRPPLLVGGVAMWWGYVSSWIARKEQLQGGLFRKFLRKYQWSCLIKGKKKATMEQNTQGATIWNPSASPKFPFEGQK